MRFLIPLKIDVANLPPLVSAIRGLVELGHEVDFFSYYFDPRLFEGLPEDRFRARRLSGTPYPTGLFRRVAATLRAYLGLWSELRRSAAYDFVWMGQWDYRHFAPLAKLAGFRTPIVYQLHEHEEHTLRYCRLAEHVVVPEENRGWMTLFGAGLLHRPFVLPNCPLEHPREASGAPDPTLEALRRSGRRIVLYQGWLEPRQRCLWELLEAVRLLPEEFVLAMMVLEYPDTESRRQEFLAAAEAAGLRERVCFIPQRPPPDHLNVIGQAHVGVGLYRPTSLNQVYCAPNRLYEFSGFGIPVVLPGYPGIRQIASRFAGVLPCDPEDPRSIAAAISSVSDPGDYARASAGATRFFEREGQYLDRLRELLERVAGRARSDHDAPEREISNELEAVI